MDDDTAMTAAVAQAQPRPSPPRAAGSGRGFFAFLKDGVLVTTRNRGLFLRLAALHAARLLAWLAVRFLAYWYLGRTLGLKANGEDRLPLSTLLDKLWWLLAAGAAYLVVKVAIMVLGLAIQLATVCAAVASCSAASIDGGPGRTTTLTLASLLGEVRRNLSGYVQTFVFVQVAGLASFVAWMLVTLVTLGVLAAVDAYAGRTPAAFALVFLAFHLHFTATLVVSIYDYATRQVAVVVSVAEPGLRAGGALRRARRLTRGAKKAAQATLHVVLSWALNKAVWKMYEVAVARVPDSIADADAPFWLGAVLVYLLVGAVEVLYRATVTAYYFDCKRTEEKTAAGHIHME